MSFTAPIQTGYRRWISHLLKMSLGVGLVGASLGFAPMTETAPNVVTTSPPSEQPQDKGIQLPSLPFSKQTTSIESLGQASQTVEIVGQVRRSVPLIDGRLYQVQDDTGSIWVAVDRSVVESAFAAGNRIAVRGTVTYKEILIDGANLSEYYLQAERAGLVEAN